MASIMPLHEFFYGERESVGYNDFHYEQLHPTTFDLMLREAARVHGYRERADAFRSGASSSCNDGATLTRKSSRVQQGNRDRRSYVDMRDSLRYTRTVCPGYKGSPAITHYVSESNHGNARGEGWGLAELSVWKLADSIDRGSPHWSIEESLNSRGRRHWGDHDCSSTKASH